MNMDLNTLTHILIGVASVLIILKRLMKEVGGIKEIKTLTKTSEMLSEDLFWSIVHNSLLHTTNQDGQKSKLISNLEKLTLKEIIGFRLRTDKLLYDTYNSEMWCAGYIMNGGCSDDSFEYFRLWIISRGKDVYYAAKSNPDALVSETSKDRELYDFEDFWYVALEAFKIKTGKNLYDYIDYDNFVTREGKYQQFNFTWKEEDLNSMKKICPKLFEEFQK